MAVSGDPNAVGTRYTLDFVRRSLPPGAGRVLEIGCGAGELASALAGAGLEVVALDMDPETVAAASARGVDARTAEWPDFEASGFDAILFTRSLHHVHRLERSVEAAFAALRPGGRIIVEDFRAEGAGERSEGWFRSLARMLDGAGLIAERTRHLQVVLGEAEAHEHEHQLHSSLVIEEALRASGSEVSAEDSAYYFRYLLRAVSEKLGDALLGHELELMAAGLIDPLGRRFVAERP